jgi:transposase
LEGSLQREDIMPKEQRTFTKEFKLEAVQLVQKSGKSQAQIARDLGIADSPLHHWWKAFAEQGSQAFPGSGHQTAQEEELRRLKRELEVIRQERDILKKALAIFSRSQLSVILSLLSMRSGIQ